MFGAGCWGGPACLFQGICGAEGTPAAFYIPDFIIDACRAHDRCYDDCASKCQGNECRLQCDANLRESGFWGYIYGTITEWFGEDAYNAAVEENGQNCDNCN